MSKKKEVIEAVFKDCIEKGNLQFDNSIVSKFAKELNFTNPFDATKIDNTDILPDLLKEKNYFIIHLGEGRHQFIKGISKGYHKFEEIETNLSFEWKYRKSILNEHDSSESNILSVAFNQRIIHDFLYDDIVASPKMYNSRRTKKNFKYFIDDQEIQTNNLQMEIDLTTEYLGNVTIFEGKNNFPINFAVYQLYLPFLYFYELQKEEKLPINEINCCYILRKRNKNNSVIRIYLYIFENPYNLATIKLKKASEYVLIQR